ncbi:phosphodiesterase [Rhodobacteraceae bacterium 2376]|uniref:Phosphodiesterase n=1 Tax=Rhabdonatronobacter sediminivivens TaxID=2743469 RepID=A0A7Z0HXZ8_9RHOB|nr:phosphodiesterase [Rhabdonatronobacter sediminivivens]NYS24343.1 phosphodiesterase [Rhabdonatronobacter sediminivivens]
MKLIVFSDLHLTAPGTRVIGIDPWERFEAALAHAQALHPDAARYVLLGDLVNDGPAEVYDRLAERLAALPLPVSVVPGNHDDRAALDAALPDLPRAPGGYLQSVVDTPDHRLIFLDSLSPDVMPFHGGALCAQRLEWFASALDGAGERRVVVFMHHPPFDVGFVGMDRISLKNADAFWSLARGRVAHLVIGHVHRTISGSCNGAGFTVLKSLAHQTPMDMQTEDTSLSVPEPGAYGIVLLGQAGVVVHSDDFTLPAVTATGTRQPAP